MKSGRKAARSCTAEFSHNLPMTLHSAPTRPAGRRSRSLRPHLCRDLSGSYDIKGAAPLTSVSPCGKPPVLRPCLGGTRL
jgi:hypothetical protein